MKIELKTGPRAETIPFEIERGMTIETLVSQFNEQLPYRILTAKVNNKVEELTMTLDKPCSVEFLDMRNQAANLIYQYSLSLIYLKAINDILGKVNVDIQNSLNKGLYTTIKTKKPIEESQVRAIEDRMREIVADDIPFVKQVVSKQEAFAMLAADNYEEKAKLLRDTTEDVDRVKFYSLDGFRDFFYGLMVPSTRYIEHFELRKYRFGVLLRFPHSSVPDKIPEYVDEVKLYNAFGEATRWSKIMGVSYVADFNEKVRSGAYKELIQLSEALHEKKTAEIADMIAQKKKRIILIAGPSSSGKTTFARRLCIQLKVNGFNPLYMSTDDYFVERSETPMDEHGEPDYEGLCAIDVKLFNENMNALLSGQEVDLPTFDFMAGTKRFGQRRTSIKSNQLLVIEGIHALNEAMTLDIAHSEKFKIYISPFTQLSIDSHNRIPTTDARMLRRMVRDFQFRGHSAQSTIRSWPKVRAGEDKNIFPYNGEADVFFNSAHIYELAVLKKYAMPLLEAIKQEEPEYCEAVRMLKFIRFFETIEDDSIIVNNSIIREFIGGSIFV